MKLSQKATAGDGWVPYKGNSKVLHKIYEDDGTEDGKVFGVIITLMPGAPSFMLQETAGDHTGKSLKRGSAKTIEENKKKCDEAYEKLGRKAHAASKGCGNKECPGFFVDDTTTEIHKCDACNLFESDKKASQYLDGWLSKAGSKLRPSRATASINEQFETVYCNKKVPDKLLDAMEKDFPWDIARVDDKSFNLYYDTSNIEKSHKVITDLLDKHLGPAGIEVEELAP
jgi:hypothetical protein